MKRQNNFQASNQLSESEEFKQLLNKFFISFKPGNNEFYEIANDRDFFYRFKNFSTNFNYLLL